MFQYSTSCDSAVDEEINGQVLAQADFIYRSHLDCSPNKLHILLLNTRIWLVPERCWHGDLAATRTLCQSMRLVASIALGKRERHGT